MVGHHFVEQLGDQDHGTEITVLCAKPRLAYDRVHLSEYFSGKTAAGLALTTGEHYDDLQVSYKTNARVSHIDKVSKTVTTEAGETFAYEKLVLATGSILLCLPSREMISPIVWFIAPSKT